MILSLDRIATSSINIDNREYKLDEIHNLVACYVSLFSDEGGRKRANVVQWAESSMQAEAYVSILKVSYLTMTKDVYRFFLFMGFPK